jgi:hypothetical protein
MLTTWQIWKHVHVCSTAKNYEQQQSLVSARGKALGMLLGNFFSRTIEESGVSVGM